MTPFFNPIPRFPLPVPAPKFAAKSSRPTVNLSPAQVMNYYVRHGFKRRDTRGSHGHVVAPGVPRPLTVVLSDKEVPRYILAQHAKTLGTTVRALYRAIVNDAPIPSQRLSVLA